MTGMQPQNHFAYARVTPSGRHSTRSSTSSAPTVARGFYQETARPPTGPSVRLQAMVVYLQSLSLYYGASRASIVRCS